MINHLRHPEPPPSLARRKAYDGCDVREQLYGDGRGKCYLCEARVELGGFEIDHLEVQHEDPDNRRYDWRNLYCICRSCNLRRRKNTPPGGWLRPEDGPEGRLIQEIKSDEKATLFFCSRSADDREATNTAGELQRLHAEPSAKTHDLRDAIVTRLQWVQQAEKDLLEAEMSPDSENPDAVVRRREWLRTLVSRDAPFTALIRSRVSHRYRDLLD